MVGIKIETFEIIKIGQNGQEIALEICRLHCIYNDEPLGFEKDPLTSKRRIHVQCPLEEVDLGNDAIKRSTFISTKIEPSLKSKMIEFLRGLKDCFA